MRAPSCPQIVAFPDQSTRSRLKQERKDDDCQANGTAGGIVGKRPCRETSPNGSRSVSGVEAVGAWLKSGPIFGNLYAVDARVSVRAGSHHGFSRGWIANLFARRSKMMVAHARKVQGYVFKMNSLIRCRRRSNYLGEEHGFS